MAPTRGVVIQSIAVFRVNEARRTIGNKVVRSIPCGNNSVKTHLLGHEVGRGGFFVHSEWRKDCNSECDCD